jgi:thymidylate kinase
MVCFSGIDGSGKTAHAKETVSELQRSGRKCRYLWFGTPYFLSYPFMAFCRFLNLTRRHYLSDGISVSEHQYYRNRVVAWLWPWIQYLDLSLFVLLRVYVPLWRDFAVVCDRFVHDTLVEIMADVNDNALFEKFVGGLILNLTPRYAKVFFLDIDEHRAFERRNDVPNLGYLTRRRNCYNLIGIHKNMNISIINGKRSFDQVHQEVVNSLEVAFGK